jgi:hypothetical protein
MVGMASPGGLDTEIRAPVAADAAPPGENTELRSPPSGETTELRSPSSGLTAPRSDSWAPVPPIEAPPASVTAGPPARRRRRWVPVAALAVLAAGGAAGAVVATSGSSKKKSPPVGAPFDSALKPVPDNRVSARGSVTVALRGTLATVTVNARGLLNGAPHAMHIHAGGRGVCPPASAARRHNGHLTISTTDGIVYYGDTVVSLTTVGDTSPRSIIDFTRYPTTGTIAYHRTIRVSPKVAAEIRDHNAVVVVHGIDYNGNGIYDNVLDRSDLSNSLTGESTAPALCGALGPQGPAQSADAKGNVYTASLGVTEIAMPGGSMLMCAPGATTQLADAKEVAAALSAGAGAV